MGVTFHINDSNFTDAINDANAVIIEFWATWCGPCRAMSMFIDKLEKEFDKITFCKANVEEAEKTAERLGIQNLPCIIFFKDGIEVNRVVGNNQAMVREIINSLVG